MIALNPSAQSLTPASIVALAGSLAFSILMICTRLVRGTSDIVLVTTQTVGALAFGAIAAPFTWVALNWFDTALLLLLGATAMVAHVCINRALKLAPASVVVPYQYTTIVWAILLGYIFFGDIPGRRRHHHRRRHLHFHSRTGRRQACDDGRSAVSFLSLSPLAGRGKAFTTPASCGPSP
jgi:drug/metabolite transporter (DMT)-like permease